MAAVVTSDRGLLALGGERNLRGAVVSSSMSNSNRAGSLFASRPDWATVFAAAVLGGSIVFAAGRIQAPVAHHAATIAAERAAPCQELAAPPAAVVRVLVRPLEVAPPPDVEILDLSDVRDDRVVEAKIAETKPAVFRAAAPRAPRTARRAHASAVAVNIETSSAIASLDEPGF